MALSIKQKKLVVALKKNYFIVTKACAEAGISREMHYRWYNESPEYRKEADLAEQDLLQIVEDKLKTSAFNAKPWAIKFFLSRKHKDYKAKMEVSEGYDFDFGNE